MKQIFAVSLESERKYRAAALFADGRLAITHCREITGTPGMWRPSVLQEVQEKAEKGFVVLVEDRVGNFSPHATAFNFDNLEDDGRTTFQHCVDLYFSLWNMGNLILDPTVKAHALKFGGETGMLDPQHDEKGRVVYKVDWPNFGGGRRALLMCVAGAMLEEPLSDRWMSAMLAAGRHPLREADSPLSSFLAVTYGAAENEIRRQHAAMEQRMAQDAQEASHGD